MGVIDVVRNVSSRRFALRSGRKQRGDIGMKTSTVHAACAVLVAFAPLAATAEPAAAPPIQFLRGTVTAVTPSALRLKTKAGKVETVQLSKDWNVQVTKPVTVAEIKSGSFIGTAEMPQPDGTGRSLEVHVFPPGMKVGEGHYGWSLKKGSMMTNGTVGKVVASPSGRAFDVSYPTGTRHIVVPPRTPIVQIGPGPRSLVKVGARVFIPAAMTPGGLATNSVAVGANGTAPPM
jgi:hypothetical protein